MGHIDVIHVASLDDPRLEAYTKLTERQLRSVLEPEKGIFIAESAKVIERAVEAGLEPLSFLLGERWLDQLSPLFEKLADNHPERNIPVFIGEMDLLEQLTGFSVTRGALAAFRRPPLADARDFLAGLVERAAGRPVRVCVLEGIVDHSNVGAIFRSAAALNVDGILASPTCVDPLYRRSARVSMGTVFQVPWTRIGSEARVWPRDGLSVLHDAGFTCAAMALSDDSVSLDDPALQSIERLAVFMGTEGAGLQQKTIAGCDRTVRIPMAHGVDSLNVAAASAVAFWQLCPHVDNGYTYKPGMFA
ncbi:MAG: TrmH family RNA methyltransferase [Collinsella stercoris]|uniref:TrmH family RNA methyltransferase n=1 Tax=Collinsella stercoris TaxID=147206 RepID=UPI003995384A